MVYIHIQVELSLPVKDFLGVDELRKSKMADESNPDDVARCLNSLMLLNMHNIASKDVLSELVNDYFVTRPIVRLRPSSETGDEVEPEGSRTAGVGSDTHTAMMTRLHSLGLLNA